MMGSMTLCHRTLLDQHGRGRRQGGLGLLSIPLVVLMLALLSMPACSKDREDGAGGKTESKPAGTTEPPKMGGHTFSSDLPLAVFIIREAEGGWEAIGETPSARPLDIPRCASWRIVAFNRVEMKTLAREIKARKVPELMIRDWAVDGDLAHLEGLTGLRVLGLDGCEGITDGGLVHLKGLTGLRMLSLMGCEGITDAGLAHLKGLTGLQELYLGFTKITDAGLAHLEGLTGMRELWLAGCKGITDGGLAHLRSLTKLRELELGRCEGITDAGLTHLKKALPKTHIKQTPFEMPR